MVDKSCLSYWFPRVEAAGLPVPKTKIVLAPESLEKDLLTWRDFTPQPESLRTLADAIRAAAAEVGGFPAFLRTGHGSGKHEWKDTCHLPDPTAVARHVYSLFEWSHMVDMLGLPTKVWVVRELLPTKAAFFAFEGMPVTKERRWFVEDGKVVRWHPYWPGDALEATAKEPDWRERLEELNRPDREEVATLRDMSLRVSRALPGAWSVDWLWVEGRGWVLIDMADAARSWTWKDWTPPEGLE